MRRMITSFCWIKLDVNSPRLDCIKRTLSFMDVIDPVMVVIFSVMMTIAAAIRLFDALVSVTSSPISFKWRRMACCSVKLDCQL